MSGARVAVGLARSFSAIFALSAASALGACGDDDAAPVSPPAAGGAAGGVAGSSGSTGGVGGIALGEGGAGSSVNGGSGSPGKGGAGGAGSGGKGGSSGAGNGGKGGSGGSSAGEGGTSGAAGEGGSTAGAGGKAGGGAGGAAGGNAGSAGSAPKTFAASYPIAGQFPEGGTYDATGHAFYVGSLKDGAVRRIDGATGAETTLFTETAKGKWWTLGMDVDVERNRLWVCAMDDRSPLKRAGRVWVFDLATKARVADFPLAPAFKDGTCTDVAVAKDGTGYVVDRENPVIYKLTVDTAPTVFVNDPLLAATFPAGQNGMVILPDQSAIISLVYGKPALVRVDLASAKATAVALTGGFNDPDFLAGPDGLTYADGKAYVAFTNRFARVTPASAEWKAGTSVIVDTVPKGLTDVISTPGGLYLLNGQSIPFATGTVTQPFALVRFTESFGD